jgi:TonB family protein
MLKTNNAAADSLESIPSLRAVRPISNAPQSAAPTRIGKYEVESEVGNGSQVKVFRAVDRQTERRVTLKLLMDVADAAFVERFRREVALAANISSPAFAAVYEVGEHAGFTFTAMQRSGDDDMRQVLKRIRFLSLLQKMSMMWEVAEGAHAAHRAGLAYVGIRPSAIALSDRDRAFVQDFGIVRLGPEDQREKSAYLAPEELEGAPPDRLCDIFAFGALYYHLLTGRDPSLSADRGNRENEMPLRQAAPDCPEALERLVRRTLEKRRDLRYRSFEEIQEDAEPVLRELKRSRAAGLLDEARAFVEAKDFEGAQGSVREALDLDPNNSQAERLRVEIRAILKRQMARPRIEALLRETEEARAAGNFSRATEILDSSPELEAPEPDVAASMEALRRRIAGGREAVRLAAEARQFLEQGRLAEARVTASQALSADSERGATVELLGEIEAAFRRREHEAKVEQGLAQVKPLLLLESFDAAIAVLTALSAECPGFPIVGQWLERANAQKAGAARTAQIESRFHDVRSLLSDGRFDQATAALEALAEQFPEADVSDLLTRSREGKEREARVTQALEEAGRLVAQDRPDLAVQFMRDQAGELGADARFAASLAEIEATLREWTKRRSLEGCLRQVAALEQIKQWSAALTVLEEALLVNPGSGELLAAAERVRGRLLEQERRRRLAPQLEVIGRKLAAQDWSQALAMIAAARTEFPGETELAPLEQTARAALRGKAESTVSEIRQCLANGETDRAEQMLRSSLEALPGEPQLTALLQELETSKRYRSEWRTAQALYARRELAPAEDILVQLDAEAHPEVQALLEKVREARAATEEVELYKQLASGKRSKEQNRAKEEPAPILAAKTAAEPEGQARPREADPAPANPYTPSLAARKRLPWAAVALLGALVLVGGVLLNHSRGKTPATAPAPAQGVRQDAAPPTQVEPARALVVASVAAPTTASAPAADKPDPFAPPSSPTQPAPKALRGFDASTLGGKTQSGPESAALSAPPPVQTGRLDSAPAGILSEVLTSSRPIPPPPSGPSAAAATAASGVTRAAAPISQPAPEMPVLARQQSIYGAVDLQADIDKQGVVRGIKSATGNPMLAAAAKQAVMKWRYQPALLNGQPVESEVTVHVVFRR